MEQIRSIAYIIGFLVCMRKETKPRYKTEREKTEDIPLDMAKARAQLRRTGCPPTRIPRFSGRTWVCEDPQMQIYTLGDGTKCCRTPTSRVKAPQVRKEIPFAPLADLAPVQYKPDDKTKILNPWTGRWVKITGERGRQVVATFGLPK